MVRWLRDGAVALVIILIAVYVVQWNRYQKKSEIREDALLYFAEEDYAKTIQYLDQALKIKCIFAGDLDEDMTGYKAESYFQLEEYEKAEELFRSLMQKYPNKIRYYMLLGECLGEDGQESEAISILLEGWEKTNDADLLNRICDIYISDENYEQAMEYAEKGGELGEDDRKIFLYKQVIICEKQKDYEKAYKKAQEYCEEYPDDEDAAKELIFLSTRI